MCTAISYNSNNHYFGRNLDIEKSYGEHVIITPENYKIDFKSASVIKKHYAIIGIGIVVDNYPLYYDATNEHGLSIAGLNFVGNACYFDIKTGCCNVAPYELIPLILSKCKNVDDAEDLLKMTNIINVPFNNNLSIAQLHWMIADNRRSITVESSKIGLSIHNNPIGVLTNNPPFEIQMFNLNNYMGLSNKGNHNTFNNGIPLKEYSRGMGALGLPGDYSSMSRFIKAAFVKSNSIIHKADKENINQFFHILNSVSMPLGSVITENGDLERTLYTSCCNTDECIYYYKTYSNNTIAGVDMYKTDFTGEDLITIPLLTKLDIYMQN